MLGTQPVQRQSPPTRPRSTTATFEVECRGELGRDHATRAHPDDHQVVAVGHRSRPLSSWARRSVRRRHPTRPASRVLRRVRHGHGPWIRRPTCPVPGDPAGCPGRTPGMGAAVATRREHARPDGVPRALPERHTEWEISTDRRHRRQPHRSRSVGGSVRSRPLGARRAQQVLGPSRRREEEPLGHVAAELARAVALQLGLDAFRDDLHPERMGHLRGGEHDGVVGVARAESRHERLIDLELIERELLQVAERRVPRAEVVDGESDPEILQPPQRRDRRVDVVEEHALGDLEAQQRRRDPGRRQARSDALDELRSRQLAAGEVHREQHRAAGARDTLARQLRRTPARSPIRRWRRSARSPRRRR